MSRLRASWLPAKSPAMMSSSEYMDRPERLVGSKTKQSWPESWSGSNADGTPWSGSIDNAVFVTAATPDSCAQSVSQMVTRISDNTPQSAPPIPALTSRLALPCRCILIFCIAASVTAPHLFAAVPALADLCTYHVHISGAQPLTECPSTSI